MSLVGIYDVLQKVLTAFGNASERKTRVDVSNTYTASWNIYNPLIKIESITEPHLKTFDLKSKLLADFFTEFVPVESDGRFIYSPIIFSSREPDVTLLPCFLMRNNIRVRAEDAEEKVSIKPSREDRDAVANYIKIYNHHFGRSRGVANENSTARTDLPSPPRARPLSARPSTPGNPVPPPPQTQPQPRSRPPAAHQAASSPILEEVMYPDLADIDTGYIDDPEYINNYRVGDGVPQEKCDAVRNRCPNPNTTVSLSPWCDLNDHELDLVYTDSTGVCHLVDELLPDMEKKLDHGPEKPIAYPSSPLGTFYGVDELIAIHDFAVQKGINVAKDFTRFYRFVDWLNSLRTTRANDFEMVNGKEFGQEIIRTRVANIVDGLPEVPGAEAGPAPPVVEPNSCQDFQNTCDEQPYQMDDWCRHNPRFLVRNARNQCYDVSEAVSYANLLLTGSREQIQYPYNPRTGFFYTLEDLTFFYNAATEKGLNLLHNFSKFDTFVKKLLDLVEENPRLLDAIHAKPFPELEHPQGVEIRTAIWEFVNGDIQWTQEGNKETSKERAALQAQLMAHFTRNNNQRGGTGITGFIKSLLNI